MRKRKSMTLIEAIEKLDQHQELRSTLLRSGALSPMLFSYADIYKHYQHLFTTMKHKKIKSFRGKAIDETAEKFNVCRATVYLALKKMKNT